MKKVSAVVIAVALVACMGLGSCKKCSTCTATDRTTGIVIQTSPEFCGTKAYLDDTEQSYKDTWGLVSNVTCE
jgi:hypothetical protein